MGSHPIRALWQAMEARDWAGVEALLAADFRCDWPQSGERFDKAGFLRVNREYPGDWHIRLCRLVDAGPEVVSEIEVELDGRLDRAISFFELQAGQVLRLREFWPEPFEIPHWRRGWAL